MIRLLILDVDGVLTTGALPYGGAVHETKVFHVQDGLAIKLWQRAGGIVAIISGRDSASVIIRAKDLGINFVWLGVSDKLPAFAEACAKAGVTSEEAAIVGDDLLDVPVMRRCGYPIAVANAVPVAKRASCYITRRRGGDGAVAEAVERLLRLNGQWTRVTGSWLEGYSVAAGS